MKNNNKIGIFIALALFLGIAVLFSFNYTGQKIVPPAEAIPYDIQAETGDNVFGWAWNDSIGWVSFNSINCDRDNNGYIDPVCGGCDSNLNDTIYGDGNGACAPPNSTLVINYGVDFDLNGAIASAGENSYAWSETMGWIRFDPPNVETDAPLTPDNPRHGVIIDYTTMELSGWARICALAADSSTCSGGTAGWISLADADISDSNDYGVSLGADSVFNGYAFSDEFGWLSFSSNTCDKDKDGLVGPDEPSDCPAAGSAIARYGVGLVANVYDYAWSGNYGWISLNCANDGAEGCANFYGVNIDPKTNNLGGYAWSSNLGWIAFEGTSTPYDDFRSSCPDSGANCTADNLCTACFNLDDEKIYGWARALAFGDDGWIRLDDDDTSGAASNLSDYGLELSGQSISGWAWGGNDSNTGIGWISFDSSDCNDYQMCTSGDDAGKVCDASNCDGGTNCSSPCGPPPSYNAQISLNVPPTVDSMTAPNWGPEMACVNNSIHANGTGNALGARLEWNFYDPGDVQSAYQIRVCREQDFSDTCTNDVLDTNKVNSTDGYYEFTSGLDYDTEYSWGLQVWDSLDYSSGWIEFQPISNPSEHQVTDGRGVTGQDRWQTHDNEFPVPEFSWFPENPSADEQVMFIAASSTCYDYDNIEDPLCVGAQWHWERNPSVDSSAITWPLDENDSYNASTTIIRFTQPGLNVGIDMTLTDASGYSCSTSTISDKVKQKLPEWKEGR